MPDNDALPAGTHEPAEIEKIDLAKYRTSDLAEQLTELLSVPAAFSRILKTAFLIAVLSIIACYIVHVYSDVSLIRWLLLCAYSLAAGLIFGIILGVLLPRASISLQFHRAA